MNTQREGSSAEPRPQKSAYQKPRLFVYGDIREITQEISGASGQKDNPYSSTFMTGGML